jgi:hypothetical protein
MRALTHFHADTQSNMSVAKTKKNRPPLRRHTSTFQQALPESVLKVDGGEMVTEAAHTIRLPCSVPPKLEVLCHN